MKNKILSLTVLLILLLSACSAAPQMQTSYDPADLRFDGERAYALENEFVTKFPNRVSGLPNIPLAVDWLQEQFTGYGLECQVDVWEVVNYSRPTPMRNLVCKLPGDSPNEIVVAAHHDASPATIQGADNDGSGISILLQLGEIFASEGQQPYTLVFIATDGEEYGMLGSYRYVQTHSNTDNIIAAISLDNLGKYFYNGMAMEPVGQFHKVGALWLQLLAGEAARAAGDLWVPSVKPVMDQLTGQAVPLSFMDQGPFVAVGVPALGFAGAYPAESNEIRWQTYHTPEDLMKYQSAEVLYQTGRIPEALIRELLSMKSFPRESGPYLYFENSHQVLRGIPLYSIFIGLVALFFLGGFFIGGTHLKQKLVSWKGVLPHFLSLWLPLVASVVMLYLFVGVGLMDQYELYPATTKDPETLNPHWPAVILFLVGMALFLTLSRRMMRRLGTYPSAPAHGMIKSFALFIVGLAGVYMLVINPFSLLFFIPILSWFLIGSHKGFGRILDILFFLLGGLMVYFLFYFFGFLIQRMNFAVLWYVMIMFSIREISFLTASVIMAMLAAGLMLIVNPPLKTSE